MAEIPKTSTTLLREIAQDTRHARWSEFVTRYRPMMEAYMRERFPTLDADDIIQETFIALMRAFPSYRYSPDEKGCFHNYLTGILRHRALAAIAADVRRTERESEAAVRCEPHDAEKSWRESLFEVALQQMLADDTIHNRTKQVFVRVAVNGEKPEDVAASFGITRNAVDQMKARLMARLRELVNALEIADDPRLDGTGA